MLVIRNNILFSIAYNILGASLALVGILDPLIAAVLMPMSSLSVVFSSWRGRTFETVRALGTGTGTEASTRVAGSVS
jgi:cation transport ATPase